MELTADLLGPHTGGVGEQRAVGVELWGLAAAAGALESALDMMPFLENGVVVTAGAL
jgi:hypothetical protein